MIDWMTLMLERQHVSAEDKAKLASSFGRTLCIDADGVIKWEKINRETVRSDTHQVQVFPGARIEICGSPARVNSGHNVFGSGDPIQCFRDMVTFVNRECGLNLTLDFGRWTLTKLAITHNYDLGGATEVRQALNYLKHAGEGRVGHYRIQSKSESVYWNAGSGLRTGKAYHKGPHLQYQLKKQQCDIQDYELMLADRLLRLELELKGQYWRERSVKPWWEYSEEDLNKVHEEFFGRFIGKIEVTEMGNLSERLKKVAPSEGYAMAAYRTWSLIKAIGIETARDSMPKATWYKHIKILRDAGLSDSDLSSGNIIPLRRRTIELGCPVESWDDMRKAA